MSRFSKDRIIRTGTLPRYLGIVDGFTLIELLVVVVIIGILAAIGIPSFTAYIKNSRISEAQGNIQGIIEAEQAFFTRFQRYTPTLPLCPTAQAAAGRTQIFDPTACDGGQAVADGWTDLGWTPDGSVYFQYQVFSAYPANYATLDPPPQLIAPAAVPGVGNNYFGVNWNESIMLPGQAQPNPWFAVQGTADTDGDGIPVFMRSNSVNYKIYRFPEPNVNPTY